MNPITGTPLSRGIDQLSRAERDAQREQRTQVPRKLGSGVFFADPVTHHYLPEKERFGVSFADEERLRREEEVRRKGEAREKHRDFIVQREMGKWDREDHVLQKQQVMLENKASKWKQGQKNSTSDAYNPISLQYDSTDQGQMLKAADDAKYARMQRRLYNLDQRCNQGFNLLNGQPRLPPDLPKPWQFDD